ncbi:MAG: T9SS type A sorting domain-containing protein [Flavobacteriales bacterium]|jgi:hypothetical protein
MRRSFTSVRTLAVALSTTFCICAHAQWQPLGLSNPGSAYAITVKGNALYVGVHFAGVFRSTNHGASFVPVNTGLEDLTVWWLTTVGDSLFCGTQTGPAYRSTDNGSTWVDIGGSGIRYFEAHNDTLYRAHWNNNPPVSWTTANDTAWYPTAMQPGTSGIWPLISHGGQLFMGAQSGGVSRIASAVEPWAYVNSGLTSTIVYSFASMGNKLFVGTENGGIFQSTDLGNSWTASGLSGSTVYALHARDSLLFAGTNGQGVYLSLDSGVTWLPMSSGTAPTNVVRLTSDDIFLYAGALNTGASRFQLADWPTAIPEPTGIQATLLEPVCPNPCTAVLNFTVTLAAPASTHIVVTDALGRTVLEHNHGTLEMGRNSLLLNTADLSGGAYVLRVHAGANVLSQRFLVGG